MPLYILYETKTYKMNIDKTITKPYLNDLSYKIVGCAIEVHKHLGPGLLESIYHECLRQEFF